MFGKRKRIKLANKFLQEIFPRLNSGYIFCVELVSIRLFLEYWILHNDTPSVLICHYELQKEYTNVFTQWLISHK